MSKQRPPLTKQQKIGFRVAAGLLPILAIIIAVGAINERNAPTPPAATTTEAPAAQERVEAAPEPKPASAEPKAEAVLTVENNEDFAALLAAVEDYDLFKEFSAKYKGRTIKFDGTIAAMNHHGDYKTRYDIGPRRRSHRVGSDWAQLPVQRRQHHQRSAPHGLEHPRHNWRGAEASHHC